MLFIVLTGVVVIVWSVKPFGKSSSRMLTFDRSLRFITVDDNSKRSIEALSPKNVSYHLHEFLADSREEAFLAIASLDDQRGLSVNRFSGGGMLTLETLLLNNDSESEFHRFCEVVSPFAVERDLGQGYSAVRLRINVNDLGPEDLENLISKVLEKWSGMRAGEEVAFVKDSGHIKL